MPRAVVLLLCLAGALVCAPSAGAARGLTLGFSDRTAFTEMSPADVTTNIAHAKAAGASIVRFELRWSTVAPTRPPSQATAADPGWSGYRWAETDAALRRLAAAGLKTLPIVLFAPRWAEGSGRPPASETVPRGTWKPSASALQAFATAAARRYSGSFPDPEVPGATLPRVDTWQAWNEPNLYNFLTPQWRRTDAGIKPLSPDLYRSLLNAVYAGIKAVNPAATIVTAGTAPYGDPNAGDPRMRPARFWRALLCVNRAGRRICERVVRFDAYAHHPYSVSGPRRRALNDDDVGTPDLAKITRPLERAIRLGNVKPRRSKALWITEISWDSEPDPYAFSLTDQARYLAGGLNVLWRAGAKVVLWWNLRDEAPDPSWAATFQSGIFFRGATPADDRRKPSYRAYRFPFTAYRSGEVAQLWGLAPGSGTVTIEAQRGESWTRVTRIRAGANRIFTGRRRVARGTVLRARWGTMTSDTWPVS